ncbi:hypothetical protein RYH73_03465 [Olivibacter sp. CPCC 100613]|uniref:hypothetical protein n=1 Tax=Olivibacter sp. CPCC 100613 TaxID=3079931 RepID=UPI002FF788B7
MKKHILIVLSFFITLLSCRKDDKQDLFETKVVQLVFSPGGVGSTFGYTNATSGDKGNRTGSGLTTLTATVRPGDQMTLQMNCDRKSDFNQEIRIVMDNKELVKSGEPQYSDERQTVYVLNYTFGESLFRK